MPKKVFPLPSVERLKTVYDVDFEAGRVWFKHRPQSDFDSHKKFANWESQFAGKETLCYLDKGYGRGILDGKSLRRCRVIWKMWTGEDPDEMDHINGIRHEDRIPNLRSITPGENMKNKAVSRNKKNGVIGVWFYPQINRYRATIRTGGKDKYIGIFKTLEEAAAARKKAQQELGFHENHGRKPRQAA